MSGILKEQADIPVGTRFRVFPQYPGEPGFEEPAVIVLKPKPGTIGSGPDDGRLRVIDAVAKTRPYTGLEFPPYRGTVHAPVAPDPSGHFDRVNPSQREFKAVHAYACLRLVLDIWESYLGHPIHWLMQETFPQIEVIPRVEFPNAQASPGSIELGYALTESGERRWFALSFDVLAHEMGHIILGAEVGISGAHVSAEYIAFQESMADLISLISVLHIESFSNHLLTATNGNLYAPNELNRLAELSPTSQIRSASHNITMLDLPFRYLPRARLTQSQLHLLGQPLTGALFDVLVEVFQQQLVEYGAIPEALARLSMQHGPTADDLARIDRGFSSHYAVRPEYFHQALRFARDFTAERLVRSWELLKPERLTLLSAAAAFLTADRAISGERYQKLILECIQWRKIAA